MGAGAGSAACDYEAYWGAYHVDILLYLTRIGRCRRKHSHEGGGADARFGIVTNNLIAHALEGGDGARNLFVSRLCLERGPAPIDELYDEVDLKPCVVTVVPQRLAVGVGQSLGIYVEVTMAEILEEQPKGLSVTEQGVVGHPEHGNDERRVGKVAFGLGHQVLFGP